MLREQLSPQGQAQVRHRPGGHQGRQSPGSRVFDACRWGILRDRWQAPHRLSL